ncbi:pirin family protein [Achromobacter sp. LC458]|uniref:Pirin family protein n=1 Tax=Achromobacter spanius TaxID=217203 RepID=A0A2S5GKA1_9BURK|nr:MULTISPECIES: pirin family protein [Achromobacter]AYD64142.1 pirin family protein [Achromobacter sp. B7]MDX3985788.1 pirin family protein [Achromobacter sp.]PPA73346.1 pirin family protein [Achromobacter spanius]QYJ23606.1 pirin family protein [Achromobacter sp. ES-001]TRM52659.1 pirin family protein [Achromobacter sp. LC458]
MKKILGLHAAPRPHWVGDGFPVRSMFSYNDKGKNVSPFLLLDYAGPAKFEPADHPRGVGQHPHRGFETVTIVYSGEVEHRDSTGNGGVIGPGDVQWMTAASGILHEEFHSPAFTRTGGELEMVQLWVNLPAKDKGAAAGYQGILNADIPVAALPDEAGSVRVIAGNFDGHAGPARTFTPMDVWDVRLKAGKSATFPVAAGRNSMLVVLRGTLLINGESVARDAQLALFSQDGEDITVEANNDAVFLVLSGEPIDEPVVGYGPFVMNTQAQIVEAIQDFNAGRYGQMH